MHKDFIDVTIEKTQNFLQIEGIVAKERRVSFAFLGLIEASGTNANSRNQTPDQLSLNEGQKISRKSSIEIELQQNQN